LAFTLRRSIRHSGEFLLSQKTTSRFAQSGTASGHYFHQDLLVAKRVFQNNPVKHVDIGSRIDGFVAHVASFRKIEVFDIRDLDSQIPNIYFKRADICSKEFDLVDYCDSVSSLHVIEHLGLGRYGDKVDCNSHLKGLNNIYSLLKTGGKFYFSVPIGEQRIEFNAHRVFSVKYLLNILEGRYNMDSFSYVDDGGDLFKDVRLNSDEIENNYSCIYGCGIFELTKV
jgi:SAM-dependent methyltransferase